MTDEQYLMVCQRRQGFDAFVWQTPPLGIAAQAFLLAASFDPDVSPRIALILAVFSGVLGLATVQLLMKHRQCEIEDSERLRLFEEANKERNFAVLHGVRPPVPGVHRNWIVRRSSYRMWLVVLAGFVCLAIYAAIAAIGA